MRRRKDGEVFPASVSISPIRDAMGKLIGASSIVRDISEQVELREASARLRQQKDLEAANESLTSFTYLVAHDLRAPLRALTGYSDLLREEYAEALGETGRGYADRITAASQQMGMLIDNLLQLSRYARAEIHLQPVDLSAEVEKIAAELQHEEPGRSVRFAIQHPTRALADPTLIQAVLQNLVGNAWKFTSRRDDASIEFGTMPAADGSVCYYVRDNGAGFDPANDDKLFEPFQRLHASSDFPGTGIGLASVRQIIGRHDGRIWGRGRCRRGRDLLLHPPRRPRSRGLLDLTARQPRPRASDAPTGALRTDRRMGAPSRIARPAAPGRPPPPPTVASVLRPAIAWACEERIIPLNLALELHTGWGGSVRRRVIIPSIPPVLRLAEALDHVKQGLGDVAILPALYRPALGRSGRRAHRQRQPRWSEHDHRSDSQRVRRTARRAQGRLYARLINRGPGRLPRPGPTTWPYNL